MKECCGGICCFLQFSRRLYRLFRPRSTSSGSALPQERARNSTGPTQSQAVHFQGKVSGAALRAKAMTPKIFPGVDPALVSVVPNETDRIAADRRNRLRPGRSLVHLQQRGRLRLRLSRLTPGSSPFFMTSRTRTSITQPTERPTTLVAILPVDLHARTGGLLHPDPSRLSRLARQIVNLLRQLLGILFADKPYAFVTHPSSSILLPEKVGRHAQSKNDHQHTHKPRIQSA
jgi:hypothetical protein